MTSDDMHLEVGKAVFENEENEKKIACLERRIMIFTQAIQTIKDNPHHEESAEIIKKASDPREDFQKLETCLEKRGQLSKFFLAYGLKRPDTSS